MTTITTVWSDQYLDYIFTVLRQQSVEHLQKRWCLTDATEWAEVNDKVDL